MKFTKQVVKYVYRKVIYPSLHIFLYPSPTSVTSVIFILFHDSYKSCNIIFLFRTETTLMSCELGYHWVFGWKLCSWKEFVTNPPLIVRGLKYTAILSRIKITSLYYIREHWKRSFYVKSFCFCFKTLFFI